LSDEADWEKKLTGQLEKQTNTEHGEVKLQMTRHAHVHKGVDQI